MITVTGHCCEVVWESAFHFHVDASSCVWKAQGTRSSAKPPWVDLGEGEGVVQSQYDYVFKTASALARIVAIDKLLVQQEEGSHLSKCPLPRGFTANPVAPRWIEHEDKPTNLPVLTEKGDEAFAIGHR